MGAAHRRPEPLHLWVQGPGAASLSLSTQFFSCEFRNNLKFKVHDSYSNGHTCNW